MAGADATEYDTHAMSLPVAQILSGLKTAKVHLLLYGSSRRCRGCMCAWSSERY